MPTPDQLVDDALGLPLDFFPGMFQQGLFSVAPFVSRAHTVCEFPTMREGSYDWCRRPATYRVSDGGGVPYQYGSHHIHTPRFICDAHATAIRRFVDGQDAQFTYPIEILRVTGIMKSAYGTKADSELSCCVLTSDGMQCKNPAGWHRVNNDHGIPMCLCTYHFNRIPNVNRLFTLVQKLGMKDPKSFKFKERRLP